MLKTNHRQMNGLNVCLLILVKNRAIMTDDYQEQDFDEFLEIVRRALLMVVRWIEKRQQRRKQND